MSHEEAGLDATVATEPTVEAQGNADPWPVRFARGPAGSARMPFFWGLAEASFFVLIPDIMITFVAFFAGWQRGLRAVGWAVAGAVMGGVIVFAAPHAWQSFFPRLPGIPEAMMEDAARRFADQGWWAMATGPLAGIPYKLFAAEAALQGRPLWQLVLVTPLARGWRFLAALAVAAALGMAMRHPRVGAPMRRWPWAFVALHVLLWVAVYVRYFASVRATYG